MLAEWTGKNKNKMPPETFDRITGNLKALGIGFAVLSLLIMVDEASAIMYEEDSPCKRLVDYVNKMQQQTEEAHANDREAPSCSVGHVKRLAEQCAEQIKDYIAKNVSSAGSSGYVVAEELLNEWQDTAAEACREHNRNLCPPESSNE